MAKLRKNAPLDRKMGRWIVGGLKLLFAFLVGSFANAIVFAVLAVPFNMAFGTLMAQNTALSITFGVLGLALSTLVHLLVQGWVVWKLYGWN